MSDEIVKINEKLILRDFWDTLYIDFKRKKKESINEIREGGCSR
jgi:hypothetical protein